MSVRRIGGLAGAAALAWSLGAWAEGGASDEQLWREECGGCHIAYPARFLPQRSWDQIMATLDEHFGADASVDAPTAARIRNYLNSAARAQSKRTQAPDTLRITETRWFKHEHDEVPAAMWRSEQVRSAANCSACHTDADAGRFSEESLKVPQLRKSR